MLAVVLFFTFVQRLSGPAQGRTWEICGTTAPWRSCKLCIERRCCFCEDLASCHIDMFALLNRLRLFWTEQAHRSRPRFYDWVNTLVLELPLCRQTTARIVTDFRLPTAILLHPPSLAIISLSALIARIERTVGTFTTNTIFSMIPTSVNASNIALITLSARRLCIRTPSASTVFIALHRPSNGKVGTGIMAWSRIFCVFCEFEQHSQILIFLYRRFGLFLWGFRR